MALALPGQLTTDVSRLDQLANLWHICIDFPLLRSRSHTRFTAMGLGEYPSYENYRGGIQDCQRERHRISKFRRPDMNTRLRLIRDRECYCRTYYNYKADRRRRDDRPSGYWRGRVIVKC